MNETGKEKEADSAAAAAVGLAAAIPVQVEVQVKVPVAESLGEQKQQLDRTREELEREGKGETNDKKEATSFRRPSLKLVGGSEGEAAAVVVVVDQAEQARRAQTRPQLRPLRPNLRRQVIVRGETSTSVPVISARPIELTSVLPAGAVSMKGGPPKRPTHLPARYVLPASSRIVPAGEGVPGAAGKPNRYAAWAQVQHWQAAAARHQVGRGGAGPAGSGQPAAQQGFQHHFSSAASRVLVVNPRQIVNISKHTKSRLIKSIEAVKRFSERWFSHVLLLLFLAVYACFGAYLFISFEASTESGEKKQIIEARLRIVNQSWAESQGKEREHFVDFLKTEMEAYERILNRACASGMSSSSLENQWTFWGALFYSMTVFTTIGYGHLTPVTFAGRVATMIYAIFGIPILLMVLADLGKLLTRIIKYAFKNFRFLYNKLFKKNATSQRTRKLISDNTNQYIRVARRGLERGLATYIQPSYQRIPKAASLLRERLWFGRQPAAAAASPLEREQVVVVDEEPGKQLADELAAKKVSVSSDVIITPNRQSKPVSPQPSDRREHPLAGGHCNRTGSRSKGSLAGSARAAGRAGKGSVSRSSSSSLLAGPGGGQPGEERAKLPTAAPGEQEPIPVESTEPNDILVGAGGEFADELHALDQEEEEDFDIPVSFAVFLLIVYMMLGAVVFSIWEGWNFFDSLYFVFISMSTIGFGDLVPQHPKRMIGTFIYLLFGLALTSMCINVVQEKIHATFLRAKMQIGEKMGFDLDQIMADDYYGSVDGNCEEDCDSQSVALSQTTNSLACAHQESDEQPGRELPAACAPPEQPPEGVRPSKSKDSLKLKKRAVASLPGHNSLTSGASAPGQQHSSGSFRRKSSRRREPISRQATASSSGQPPAASAQPAPASEAAPLEQQAIRSQLDLLEGGPQFLSVNEPVVARPLPAAEVAHEQPDGSPSLQPQLKPPPIQIRGLCEPLQARAAAQGRQPAMVKSRSSESAAFQPSGSLQRPYRCDSSTSAAAFRSSNLLAGSASCQPSGRKSAFSSRRSSVSQELNQLDDLIMALKSQASEDARLRPLLGISRSNSRH